MGVYMYMYISIIIKEDIMSLRKSVLQEELEVRGLEMM